MKKLLCVAVLTLFLATVGFSMGFSLKLTGGAAYITSGDYNDAIEGTNAYIAHYGQNITSTYSKLQFGMDLGVEFILNVTENIGIGLGVGYMQVSHDTETVEYDYDLLWWTLHDLQTLKPSVSAIPLTLNFHYAMPMGGVNLNFFAGVGFYLSTMKVDQRVKDYYIIVPYDLTLSYKASKTAFGFQGGIGLDIPISGNVSFVVDVTGRYARLSDIMGDYTITGTFLGTVNESGSNYYYYAYDLSAGGTTYKMHTLIDDAHKPTGSTYSRHGNFDLTGVSAQAGFRINF